MKLKALVILLASWAVAMTWMAFGKPGLPSGLFSEESTSVTTDLKPALPEAQEVVEAIEVLYSFRLNKGTQQKIESLSNIFSKKVRLERLGDLKRDLGVLVKRGHNKTVAISLLTINRNSLEVTAEIEVRQGREDEHPMYPPQSLTVGLKFVRGDSGLLQISELSESMLEPGKLGLRNTRQLSLMPGSEAKISFPCPIKSAVPLGGSSDVNYQVFGGKGELSLTAPTDKTGEEKFRVKCKKKYFDLTVDTQGAERVLFAQIEKATGSNRKKKLTKKQKIFKALEEQTGLKMVGE